MTDSEYIVVFSVVIGLSAAGLAWLEWIDPNPKDWVVRVRQWLARRKK